MILTQEEALDVLYCDNPDTEIVINEIVSTSRWNGHYRLVFKLDGKYYETRYWKGLTEMQGVGPFEYDKEVNCVEVEPFEKTVVDYRPVGVAKL